VFLIAALVVVFGSIIGGYMLHHRQLAVLVRVDEFHHHRPRPSLAR
jgi:flagellar motor component MotA